MEAGLLKKIEISGSYIQFRCCRYCQREPYMVRNKKSVTVKQSTDAEKTENRRRINAERSAYFSRREASKVLRVVLQGDAKRRAVASIKSLVYSPSVRNKKGTFALVCQTLKCKSISSYLNFLGFENWRF